MYQRLVLTVLLAAVLFGPACDDPHAQAPVVDPTPTAPSGPATLGHPPAAPIELDHMTIDPAGRRIVIQAEVCLRQGLLELLLCGWGSKEHESILHTQVQPSALHAGLLALGLAPGKPAGMFQFEDQAPLVMPPRGQALSVTLRWTDANGQAAEAPAGRWLSAVGDGQAGVPGEWIFVGSDLLGNNAYWADSSGELISVSNFPSAVLDVPFESSADNRLLMFTANTDAIPPEGTPVEVVLTVTDDTSPHARAWVWVDRRGQVRVGQTAMTMDELTGWGEGFGTKYPQCQVVIRADPRAMGQQIQDAHDAVRMSGIWNILETRAVAEDPILPRTDAQAAIQLAELRRDLAEGETVLGDPLETAQYRLDQVADELEELARLEALWQDYARQIRESMGQAPASDETSND